MSNLPRFKSHKEVEAMPIQAIDGLKLIGPPLVVPGGGPTEETSVTVDAAYMDKHEPKVGGYYIRYADGYESWSPAKAFEEGYMPTIASEETIAERIAALPAAVYGMSFGDALYQLMQGEKITRLRWDRGAFIYLVPGSTFHVNRPPLLGILPEGTPVTYRPHIDMRTPNGKCGVWSVTQGDLFSDDWMVVHDPGF